MATKKCRIYAAFGVSQTPKIKKKRKGDSLLMSQNTYEQPEGNDEEMTVTLDLEDGSSVECAIVTILSVNNQDYIVLLPLDENGENSDGEVWFYKYFEDENDANAEPVLEYISDDEEYENVADAFDEYLDNQEFDEYLDSEE